MGCNFGRNCRHDDHSFDRRSSHICLTVQLLCVFSGQRHDLAWLSRVGRLLLLGLAFSMSFNPGASGKYPITAGGKIYITGHCLFVTIITASYTGAVGPAIMSAGIGTINTFDTLKSASISIAVVGPRWEAAADPPPYLGKNRGTAILFPDIIVPKSLQFNMVQSEMHVNSAATFSIITAQNIHSTDSYGRPFLHTKKEDLCSGDSSQAGVTLGIYDMIRGKTIDNQKTPHSTIHDAPQVVFEMMQRYNNTGHCSLVAKGGRFASSSYAIGFLKNTSPPHVFSRAIERIKFKGQADKLLREASLYDTHNKCFEPLDDSESMVFSLLSGLFMVVFAVIFVGLLGSCRLALLVCQSARYLTRIFDAQRKCTLNVIG